MYEQARTMLFWVEVSGSRTGLVIRNRIQVSLGTRKSGSGDSKFSRG